MRPTSKKYFTTEISEFAEKTLRALPELKGKITPSRQFPTYPLAKALREEAVITNREYVHKFGHRYLYKYRYNPIKNAFS